jgi:branched-chain amino acid aminotransferase
MERQVWLNGRLCPAVEAVVPAVWPGVGHGLGVFETLRSEGGRVFRLREHYERLVEGCGRMGLAVPGYEGFREALGSVERTVEGGAVRLRFSVLGAGDGKAAWLAVAVPMEAVGEARLVVTGVRRAAGALLAGVKATSYAENVLLQREAEKAGGTDAVVLGPDGTVAEAAMSNLFVVRDGVVTTPVLASGCLPGIMRAVVVETCGLEGIECREGAVTVGDLRRAEEVFLTSAVRRVQVVATVDGEQLVGCGDAGVTARLARAVEARAAAEAVRL